MNQTSFITIAFLLACVPMNRASAQQPQEHTFTPRVITLEDGRAGLSDMKGQALPTLGVLFALILLYLFNVHFGISIGGVNAFPTLGLYHASKWGLEGFSQSLAQEVGPFGIRVNTIAPGNAQARWKSPEAEGNPLGRQTSGEDVGKAVAFLLSDDASHITGSCLDVSGGTTLH